MLTFTKYQTKLLSLIPNLTTRESLRRILRTLDDIVSSVTHVHGNITNAGAIGTTQHKLVVTGASGALTVLDTGTTDNQVLMTTGVAGQVEVQTMGTGSTVPALGNHVHGGISNVGAIGTTQHKLVVTGAQGVLGVLDTGTTDNQVLMTTGEVGQVEAQTMGTGSTVPALGNHVHGSITNTGYIGTSPDLPVMTGADGIVTVGAFGTGATNPAAGNHAHGNLSNTGLVGTDSGKAVMTTTGGALTAATMGTGADVPAIGNHVHGGVTNDGKIGSAATLPIITGTGGLLQAGEFGKAAGTFAEGNHAHFRGHAFTPVIPVKATLTVASGAANGDVVYEAIIPGVSEHDITIAHLTPAVADADTQVLLPFGVTVPQDSDIVVQLAGTANGAYAGGTLTITAGGGDNIETTETVTIDTTVYRCMAVMEAANDFQYDVTPATCLANLVHAIMGTGVGTNCYTGTVAHALFGATSTDLVLTLTALVAGTGNNGKATTETVADAAWGAVESAGGLAADLAITTTGAMVVAGIPGDAAALVTADDEGDGSGLAGVGAEAPLASGVDGTTGYLGDWGFDATHIYVSKGASTIIASHWYSTAQVMAVLS